MPRRNQSMKWTTSSTVTPSATLGAITVPMSIRSEPEPNDLRIELPQPMPPNTSTAGKAAGSRSTSPAEAARQSRIITATMIRKSQTKPIWSPSRSECWAL